MQIDGKWVGWGLGDNSTSDMTVKTFKAFARRMYKSYMGDLADTNIFDTQLQTEMVEMQGKLAASNHIGPYLSGILDLETEYASGFKLRPPPGPLCIFFSINGAGSTWNMGYPYDIGESLDKSRCYHQPIGYNTNPFPMMTGVNDGVAEFIRQLDMPRPNFGGRNCTTIPWTYNFYSMGAIVGMIVLMRILYGDLQRFKSTYMGGSTFGNPMRQHGHTFPGCSYSDGEGIVTPNAHDCPDSHWDFAADKAMIGSPGDDLYTKLNKAGVSAQTVADMRDVWQIVATGNPLSLMEAVLLLLAKPSFSGGLAAAEAGFQALDFFVVKGVTPHTSYQFTQPIVNDSRDCWALAQQHAADLVATLPQPYALPVAA